jgi:hypothetical protein
VSSRPKQTSLAHPSQPSPPWCGPGVLKLLSTAYHLSPQDSFGVPPNVSFVWFGLNKEIIAKWAKFLCSVHRRKISQFFGALIVYFFLSQLGLPDLFFTVLFCTMLIVPEINQCDFSIISQLFTMVS